MSFTSRDGKTFETERQMRRYEFKTFYTFAKRSGETMVKRPGEIAGCVLWPPTRPSRASAA